MWHVWIFFDMEIYDKSVIDVRSKPIELQNICSPESLWAPSLWFCGISLKKSLLIGKVKAV